ncbi:MAG: hypothetical protein V1797_05710 [Pseudomonadota bacterium]
MKRAWLIIALAVVVVVGGLWLAWPQIRLWQVQQALDHAVIPGFKAYVKTTTGLEPVITHAGVTAEGTAYAVSKVSIKLTGDIPLEISAEKLLLDQVEMSLTGDLKRCNLALHRVRADFKGLLVTVRNQEVEGLAISSGGTDIRIARELVQGMTLTAPGLKAPLEVPSIEAHDYVLLLDKEQQRFQASMGRVTVVGHDFEASAQGATIASDFISFEKGSPRFKQAKSSIKGLEYTTADKSKMSAAGIDSVSSRQSRSVADRVEVEGLSIDRKGLPAGDLAQALQDLGYERGLLNLVWDYAYDQDAKAFELKEFTLQGEQMGRFNLSFKVTDLDYDLGLEPMQNIIALGRAKPQSLSARYDDQSLAERLLAFGAKKDGMDLAAYRAKLITDLPTLPGSKTPDPALVAFINSPGSLCLGVKPKQELTLLELTRLSRELLPSLLEIKLYNCPK